MGDAAADAVDFRADLREALFLSRAQLQQLAPVVEGELVVVLPRAVGNHPVRLRESVQQVLHVHGGPDAAENEDAPAALGGVVEHPLQLLLLCEIAPARFGRLGSNASYSLRSGAQAGIFVPSSWRNSMRPTASRAPRHPPGIEALVETVEPVLVRTVAAGEHPEFHFLSCRPWLKGGAPRRRVGGGTPAVSRRRECLRAKAVAGRCGHSRPTQPRPVRQKKPQRMGDLDDH